MKKKDLYTTGELAKLTGVSYKTIRLYYESGLLTPERVEENKYKKFGQAAVEQLQKILDLIYCVQFASIPDFLVRMQAAKFIPHTDISRYPNIQKQLNHM